MSLRCDLHAHSRFSDRPTEWILRRLGVPESYTQPRALYQKVKERGCDLVTITDHNCIDGCLSIADLPGVFLSEEVTAYFPEDGCKIHLLVWDLTEAQHREISSLRQNIYELAAYLRAENLAHGVAHPFYNIDQKLTVAHFEKLVLLFRVFETLNGLRDPLTQEAVAFCLRSITLEKILELANRHNLAPTHSEPWRKSFVGGSDDHSGLYMGVAWTEAAGANDVKSFFEQVVKGRARIGGTVGDALRASTGLYHLMISCATDRLGKAAPYGMKFLSKISERFLAGENPAHIPFTEKIAHLAEAVRKGHALDFIKLKDPSLNREIAMYFLDRRIKKDLDRIVAQEPTPERRTFRMASKITNDLLFRLFTQFLKQINKGRLMDAVQPFLGMAPIAASVSPYLFAFHHLHGSRRFVEKMTRGFCGRLPDSFGKRKCAWFTDTLEDVNGVARTIRAMCKSARKAGADITVITSRSKIEIDDISIMNFPPVGEFEIPEYELQKLSFPPILEIIDFIEREKFTEFVISTPGPIGLTALLAARMLGLRTSGVYHTDFPQYVRILTDDTVLETVMWSFMRWFYAQLDLVYVNSNFYRQRWMERGISGDKLEVFPRGLDTELFNPRHRRPDYWKKRGAKGKTLLYVGRISKEKELGFLCDVFNLLRKRNLPVSLALVGDGPFRKELAARAPEAIFTGILTGQELGTAYASADLFLFPSMTDTFGNVVIEALASGLPVLVSDVGGPRELITHPHEGRVLPAKNLNAWADAVEDLIQRPIQRQESLQRAEAVQSERSWDEAFRRFWMIGAEKLDIKM
ncbi:MAG: glycosyltransferase [bacterium]